MFFLWHHGELSDWQLGLAIVSLVTGWFYQNFVIKNFKKTVQHPSGLLIVFSWLYLVISWENTYTKARVYTGLRILHKILYMSKCQSIDQSIKSQIVVGGAACIAGGIYVNVRLNRDDDTGRFPTVSHWYACIVKPNAVPPHNQPNQITVASTENLGANSRRILAWVAVGCGKEF